MVLTNCPILSTPNGLLPDPNHHHPLQSEPVLNHDITMVEERDSFSSHREGETDDLLTPQPTSIPHEYRNRMLGCPCPAISILANHSYINPKDSNDPIPFYHLIKALVHCFNLSFFNAIFLTFMANFLCGNGWSVSIAQLGVHGKIEHDASLTRYDYGQGDSHNPSPERIQDFLSSVSIPGRVTLKDYAHRRIIAQIETEVTRPMTLRGFLIGLGEVGLTISVFGQNAHFENLHQDPWVRSDWLQTIFLEERLPDEWSPPLRPVTIFQVKILARSLYRLINKFN